jgi:hypothetical protein
MIVADPEIFGPGDDDEVSDDEDATMDDTGRRKLSPFGSVIS